MSGVESKHFLLGLIIIFFALAAVTLYNLFSPIILGVLLAGLAHPLYRDLLARTRGKQNLAAFIAMLAVSTVIVIPFIIILTLLVTEAFGLFANSETLALSEPIEAVSQALSFSFGIDIKNFVIKQIGPVLKNIVSSISSEIGSFLSNAAHLVLAFFVMLVTLFYMLRDGVKIGEFLIRFSPLKTRDELDLYSTFTRTAKAIFYGTFAAAAIQGILGGIGFLIFGLPSPVLWGSIMAFLALIPFLGPYIIFIPAAIYLAVSGGAWTTLLFLLYNVIIVSTVDNLVKPRVIGGQAGMHPLLILLSVLGGLQIFGFMGIIYGPLIFAIFIALVKLYAEGPAASATQTPSL